MLAAYVTPAHALLLLAALIAFFVLARLSRGGAHEAGAAGGRRVRRRVGGWRLRWRAPRQLHVAWVVVSALMALMFTRGVAMPVFVLVFLVLWLAGFGVLHRLYR
jgi:hypothetical protein